MCRNQRHVVGPAPGRGRGMGLVSAIFLILVVGLLVVAISRMVRTSGEAFARDTVDHRAFLAAESGSQLALNRVFAPAGAGSCTTWNWDLSGFGLNACSASVDCRTEVVGGNTYFTLESDGRCDVGGVVAERSVLVRAAP